jgi:hypothetical protein
MVQNNLGNYQPMLDISTQLARYLRRCRDNCRHLGGGAGMRGGLVSDRR